ncbi:hypothetical protein SDC9_180901 [bioreactor metagenome]|uniref:Uncharacterized protein n=1 Tax=bioreactor metagenome TaxID=1076179 RepID=A0A645HBE8_9ZZZZ
MQIILFCARDIGKTAKRSIVGLCNILLQVLNPGFFQFADLFVDRSNIEVLVIIEIFLCDGCQKRLDILDRKDIFKIVYENHDQDMLFGIFLLYRRRQKIIFCVIVDHRLSQNLIVLMPFGRLKLFLHKGSYLIHV